MQGVTWGATALVFVPGMAGLALAQGTTFDCSKASGDMYEGQNVEFWNKGTEVTVTWLDEKLQCRVR